MPNPFESDRTVDAPGHAADASAASDRDETAPATPRARGPAGPAFGPPAAPGEIGTLGPYRVVRQLGAGGMGAVYLTVDTRLDRKLALKVMLPEFAADRDAKERFLREARAAAKITHDNVVTVYEADEREGIPYIAMQFLQGYPLDAYLKQKGAPALPHVIRIGRETALGLAAAHALGLVHRDIKPANLWLESPSGRVKVLDFGLAKPVGSDTELTKSGAVVGTPAYMSPEQARGQKVDARTDLFSLGGVLYRLCTGKTPFAGPNVMTVMMALGNDDPTPVRELNPNVPESLAQLIHQLLAKKPEARPQTANEVAKRLLAILNQLLAPPPTAVVSSGSVPAVSAADLSVSQPVVVHALPHQPPIVVPMHVTAAPEDVFANLDEANTTTAAEPAPAAPKPERKKGGKGLLLAACGAVLFAGVAVAVVVWQMGKKGEPAAAQKPPETAPGVPAPPKDGGKPPAGSIPVLKPLGNEWVDVLALDENLAETPPNFGPWVKRNRKWSSPVGPTMDTGVVLPVWATGSYHLVAEVSLDSGNNVFVVVLPVGAYHTVGFDLNANGGSACGFSRIKGVESRVDENPTKTPQTPVPAGRVVKIALLVKVTGEQAELQATVENEPPIRWTGPMADLMFPWAERGRVGLYAAGAAYTVHSLKFQKIDGEAGVIGWGPPGSDPDRKAAEWVLSVGGSVQVNGGGEPIKTAEGLPKNWFRVTQVNLHGTPATDADLANLKGCTALNSLLLSHTRVTGTGFVHLKGCTALTFLNLFFAPVTTAGFVHIKELQALTGLYLHGGEVTDEVMSHLKDCKALANLHLWSTPVTAAGLAHLKELKALTHLTLQDVSGTDVGAAHLKECKALVQLAFGGSGVTDAGAVHLKELKALTSLSLGDARVTDAGLAHLKELKALTTLALRGTLVTDAGLIHLKDYKALTHLNVQKTMVTAKGLEVFAAALPGCKIEHDGGIIEPKVVADPDRKAAEWVLSIGGWVRVNGEDRDIKAAAELPKERFLLTYMYLSGKPVTDADLANFKELKALRGLDLLHTKVTDAGVAHLKDYKVLQVIYLFGTKVTDAGLAHLKELKGLQRLSLGSTAVTDAGLAHLKVHSKSLTFLDLHDTPVTDAGLAHLKDFKLTELGLGKTKVTAKGVAELAAAVPGCKIGHDGGVIEPTVVADPDRKAAEWVLSVGGWVKVNGEEREIKAAAELPKVLFSLTGVHLGGNKVVTDAGLANFKDCKNLKELSLYQTKVTDAGLAHFKDCKHLANLYLYETGVTDAGLVHFKDCNSLIGLDLSDTGVTDAGLAHFKDCNSLKLLHLNGAKVTDAGLVHLKELKNLVQLVLDNTKVTDAGLVQLKDCTSLKHLYVQGTKVTAKGLEALHAALPACKIEHDGGIIEPKK